MKDVLQLLEKHPEWIEINKHYHKNEGLLKSLANDGPMSYLDD